MCKPHIYRETNSSNTLTQRMVLYVLGVIFTAVIINIPRLLLIHIYTNISQSLFRFFETVIVEVAEEKYDLTLFGKWNLSDTADTQLLGGKDYRLQFAKGK